MIGWILLGIFVFLFVIPFFLSFYICYKFIFLKQDHPTDEKAPQGKVYEPYHEEMESWWHQVHDMAHQHFYTTSFDGLKLHAIFFEYEKDSPIEIMFHGYHGNALRDLSGGVLRCRELKRSILLVDHRACGHSEGEFTTFGLLESKDCLTWIDFVLKNINPDAKIILSGISMGASTVMIASSYDLPPNVVGVIADCGYTSTKDILLAVMKRLKLPYRLFYWFAKCGAKAFGKFDIEQISPIEALEHCKVPIIFFHGDNDQFVPLEMSKRNFAACNAPKKKLVAIKGAGHGISFLVDRETYYRELNEFFADVV